MARTGADVASPVGVALTLIVGGAALRRGTRRRRGRRGRRDRRGRAAGEPGEREVVWTVTADRQP